jgi:N-acetylmuramoyl-L-alanine amidase
MTTIHKHKLVGDGIKFVASPNHGDVFAQGLPDTIVIHYTAGPSAESAVKTFADATKKVSAHIVVAGEGQITQMVPFDTVAWHAGRSSYQGRDGFNRYAIGIEIVNAGWLTKSGDRYVAWFGREYPVEQVFQGRHRNASVPYEHWHRFTEAQISAVQELCELLCTAYPIRLILGHDEIAPGRKQDPGPAFPIEKLRNRVLNKDRVTDGPAEQAISASTGKVTAAKLNIRKQPNGRAALAAPPLSKGTAVTITDSRNGWHFVEVKQSGWVSAKHVKRD